MIIKAAIWWALRRVFFILLLLFTLPLIATTYLNQQIFSPPHRALQSYHVVRLQHPERFGLNIREYGCLNNKVPCLLVEPDALAGAGQRGNILRRQVAAKGIRLKKYGKIRGTIVLLHGRMGRKEDLLPAAERFVAAGFRCLIPDLPAHGDSPFSSMSFGSSAFEASLPRRILMDVRQHFNLPDEPVALWGMSMGGAFAISAAREDPDFWDALLVVSSFASLNDIFNDMLDRRIPRRFTKLWIQAKPALYFYMDLAQKIQGKPAVSTMRPSDWARQVHIPTLIVHGDHDYFISPAQGQTLYETIDSPYKRWLSVPGGGHANVLATAMPLYAEMNRWLIESLQRDLATHTGITSDTHIPHKRS